MHKRRFLKVLSAGLLGASGCLPSAGTGKRMKDRQKNWMWVSPSRREAASDDVWKSRLGRWREAGIDAILPEIFNNRAAHYGSEHLPVAGRWLEQLLPLARAAGVEVHAWMHTMTCNIDSVHDQHPEWYNVNGRGESSWEKPAYVHYYRFLCPSRPAVHEFLKRRVRELAQYDELDGIHLDYIRHPDVILAESLQPRYDIVQDREYPEYDYCYCDVCRSGFKEMHGADPMELEDPSADRNWRQYRFDLITHIVNDELVPVGRKRGKAMTAAVFPNWEHVRQQWSNWDLDAVLPMLYHSFYNEDLQWIGEEVREGISTQKHGVPLFSGLFVSALDPSELSQAIAVSLAAGASGVSLFSSGAMSDEHWDGFRTAIGRV